MINIYNIDGSVLMQAELTSAAKRYEEMSKSDYISLSWTAATKVILPVGAYILHTYNIDTVRSVTRKFLLLESYEPTQSNEQTWKYSPDFQHPKMLLGKIPFYIWTKNSKSEIIKQYVWSFVGTTSSLATKLTDFLNNDVKIGNCGWTCVVSNVTANTVSVSFSDNDFLSSLTSIVNAIGDNAEWHIDYDNEIIYLGKISIGETPVELKVGTNIGSVSVSANSEDYYNSFAVFGGTRNITQANSKGENISSSDIRLQLNAGSGTMTIDGKERAYAIDDFSTIDLREDKTKEQLLTKVLDFSDVFPSLSTYVYNVRGREKYVIDSSISGTDKRVPKTYNPDGSVATYETFTVWYMRLAYPSVSQDSSKTLVNTTIDDGVTHYWYDFEITDDLKINGKTLSCSFEANFNVGALSTPLAGRGNNGDYVGFELAYHDHDYSSHASDDVDSENFEVKAGDYEIVYQEDNDVYIPSNKDEMLIPKGESLPSLKCNITVLYNIAMADTYYTSAQEELLDTAEEEIIRLLSDLNNYTFKAYPNVFLENNPRLQIGQLVKYDDGNGYSLETRVLKLETNLDYDFVQQITVGNQAIKGTLTQLKDDVQSIITSGGSNGNGGGYTASQLSNLIAKYGTSYFLSKTDPDTAQGTIAFTSGLTLGSKAKYSLDKDGNATLNVAELAGAVLKELVSQGFSQADKTGFWMTDADESGHSYLEIDKLYVRMKAIFDELEIRKRSYVGGNVIYSCAASKFTDVVWWTAETNAGGTETSDITGIAAFKCYIKTDDGTTETENWWKVNDLAICQTFNVNENSTVRNAQNKFYWRKVTDVGSETVTYEDGSQEVRGYIMLSNTTKGVGYADSGVDHTNDAELYGSTKVVTTGTETVVTDGDILTTGTSSAGVPSDFPEAEDSVTQLGNTDSTQGRGNALEIMVYTPSQGGTSILEGATCEAPALIQYHGITGFTLANKAKVVISPSGNTFKAKSFVIETGETSVRVPLDLGEWTKGTFYAYYSRVSHNGQLWLLDKIAENASTAEEPTDGCTYWTLQVAKGEDGDGLSVKGTVKGHWTNYTAWMADGNKPTLTEGDKVALDSSSDIPTNLCPSGVAKPTIVEYVNAPDYTYTATAANEGDGYMDGDGILWVAGATAWTNAGKIKGDKGDKGDDAEWYEIVARSATSGQQVQSIALDADGNPKTSVRLVLTQHIGSASAGITPSEVEMTASEGSLSKDSSSWVLQLSTTTSDSVTVTAKYLGKTYAVTLPCVRDGKQGDPGEATDGISALALSFTPSSLVFDTDDDGTLTGSQSGTLAVARGGVDYTYGKEYTCAVSAVENLVLSDMQSILSVSGGKPVVTVNSGDIKTYDTGLTDANGNKLVFPYTEGFVDIIVTTLKTPIETQHIRLSWHVNYAKYVGRQTVTQKEFKSEYEEYTASNDQELKRVESSISQTAREISLSVSEQAIGRRNMLFGTALLSEEDLRVIYQPESSSVMTVLGGYGGTNALKGKVSYGGGFRWHGASVGNIKIEKGKTYTFSCWVKTDHACTLDFELAYESSPSDTSRPAGGVFSVIGETITTLNEWQLVKGTYTMGQDYEYVEVFVFFTNHSGSGTHCICRPMMEEGDTYNGWTLSEDDADYIGGNMLDGTRSLTLGGNLTVLTGDVTDSGFGDSAVITADASSEEKDMLQWTVADSVAKGADYIFSFWAKGTGNVTAFLYPTTGDNTYTEACDGSSAWYSDGRASLALTSEWRRYWVHWSMKSDSLAQYCLLRASGGSVSIAQPKLERGGKATDYTERSTDLVSKTQLKKKTGIDIESGIVTVTADNFVVQNNEGTRTALISADGTLNASLVQASKLETLGSTGSARVSIENGLISVFGAAGLCNIKFGVNDDGMAVLSYYNDDGVHLYDLGPNGFDDSMTTKAKVTEAMLGDILGTLGASQISDIASTGVLSLDGLWEVRKAYRQGLFGAGIDSDYSTPAGYAPTVSSSIKGKQYSCGYTEKTPTPDKERGLTTSALAKAADGLWFTGTPFAKDGALCNLLSGTYLKGTEKVRLSPKSDTLTDDIYCITLSVFTDGKEATATIYARYGKKV